MLGSAQSISGPNMVLNTIVAESLRQFADQLEGAADFDAALRQLVRDTLRAHRRIIFNGNNYADAWVEEAARRGLRNDRTTVDALPRYIDPKNVALFQTHRVLSPTELHSRYEIKLETYCKSLRIEALTMLEMVRRSILPAAVRYTRRLSQSALLKKQLNSGIDRAVEEEIVAKLSNLSGIAYRKADEMERALGEVAARGDLLAQGEGYRDDILPLMAEVRAAVDQMETLCDEALWPLPSYGKLLFSV
jgi:glutamine synthetase